MNVFCTYMISCDQFDEIYIGKTNNFKKRRSEHFSKSYRDSVLKKSKSHLYNAMNLHGDENFTMIVINFQESRQECSNAEIELIALCKKSGMKLYNITEGGDGVRIINPLNTETEKLCSKCKIVKQNKDFTKHVKYTRGLDYHCKSCKQEDDRCKRTGTIDYTNIGFIVNDDNSKWCVGCKQLLSKDSFYKTKKGEHWHCKECAKENSKKQGQINKQNNENKTEYDINITKECSGCNMILPLTPDFWPKNKYSNNGLGSACKVCCNDRAKTRRKEGKIKIYDHSNVVYDVNILKACINCNIEKPAIPDFFVKDKKNKTGISNCCKDCKNAKKRVKK